MSSLINNAMSGLNAAQAALNTASNNISSYNVAGYTRQTTIMAQANSTLGAGGWVGNGVYVSGVQREYDAFITNQLRAAQTQSSGLTVVRYQNQALSQLVQKAVPRNYDDSLPGDSKAFLAQLSLPAQLASQQSGVPHHLILAQAALESGWGQRQIRRENGEPSYNLFGVKASGNWKGPVTEITTTEYENGEAKKVKAKFRVYSSYLEALSDYVGLLTRNPRYAAVTTAASAEQGAQALQDAGYATDPHYARKLTNMIQQMKSISDKVSKTYSMSIDNLF